MRRLGEPRARERKNPEAHTRCGKCASKNEAACMAGSSGGRDTRPVARPRRVKGEGEGRHKGEGDLVSRNCQTGWRRREAVPGLARPQLCIREEVAYFLGPRPAYPLFHFARLIQGSADHWMERTKPMRRESKARCHQKSGPVATHEVLKALPSTSPRPYGLAG